MKVDMERKRPTVIPFPKKEEQVPPDAKWLGNLLAADADKISCIAAVVTFKDGSTSLATTDIDLPELIISSKFLDTFCTEVLMEHYTKED